MCMDLTINKKKLYIYINAIKFNLVIKQIGYNHQFEMVVSGALI
jgi:hypothetical protein